MKSSLINTTGIVSLSVFLALSAPVAFAWEGDAVPGEHSYSGVKQSVAPAKVAKPAKPKVEEDFAVKLGGSFNAGFLSDVSSINPLDNDDDSKGSDKDIDRSGMFWSGNLAAKGSKVLDNGVEVGIGARFKVGNAGDELRKNASDESSAADVLADRYYMYLQGIWGKVILGADSSAADSLPGGGVPSPGFDIDFSGNGLGSGSGVNLAGSSAVKATYLSPSVKYKDYSLQGGVSFTPQPSIKSGEKRYILGLGAKLLADFGKYSIQLGGGYSSQGSQFIPSVSAEVSADDASKALMGLAGSIKFNVSDLSALVIGGKYTRSQANKLKGDPGAVNVKNILVGAASYKVGPYKLVAQYVYAKGKNAERKAISGSRAGRMLEFVMPVANIENALDSRSSLLGWYPAYNMPWKGQLGSVKGVVDRVNVYEIPHGKPLYDSVEKDGKYVIELASGVRLIDRKSSGSDVAAIVGKYRDQINKSAPSSLGEGNAGVANAAALKKLQPLLDKVASDEANAARAYFNGKADEYLYIPDSGADRGGFAAGVEKPWAIGQKPLDVSGEVASPGLLKEYNRNVEVIRDLYDAYYQVASVLGVSYEGLMNIVKADSGEEGARLSFLKALKVAWNSGVAADSLISGVEDEDIKKVAADVLHYDLAIDQLVLKSKLNMMRGFKFRHLSGNQFKKRVADIIKSNAAYGVHSDGSGARMHVGIGGAMHKVSPSGIPQYDAFSMGIYSPDPADYNKYAGKFVPYSAQSYKSLSFVLDNEHNNFVKAMMKYQALRSISSLRSYVAPYVVMPGMSVNKPFARAFDYHEYGVGRFGMANQYALMSGFSDIVKENALKASDSNSESVMGIGGYKGLFHCVGAYDCAGSAGKSWDAGRYMVHFLVSGKGSLAQGVKVIEDNAEGQKYASAHVVYNMSNYGNVSSRNHLSGNLVHGPSVRDSAGNPLPSYVHGKSSMVMNANKEAGRLAALGIAAYAPGPDKANLILASYGLAVHKVGSEVGAYEIDKVWKNNNDEGMNKDNFNEYDWAFLSHSVDAADKYVASAEGPLLWMSPAAGEAMASGRAGMMWPYSPYSSRESVKYISSLNDAARIAMMPLKNFRVRPDLQPGGNAWAGVAVDASGQERGKFLYALWQAQMVGDGRLILRPHVDKILVGEVGGDGLVRINGIDSAPGTDPREVPFPLVNYRQADKYVNYSYPRGYFLDAISNDASFPAVDELPGAEVMRVLRHIRELSSDNAFSNPNYGGMGAVSDVDNSRGAIRSSDGSMVSAIDGSRVSAEEAASSAPVRSKGDDIRLRVQVDEGSPGKVYSKKKKDAKMAGFEVSLGYEISDGFDVMAGFQYWDDSEGYSDKVLANDDQGKVSYAYVGLKYGF